MKRSAEKATAAPYLRSTLFAAILAILALFAIGCSATYTVTMSVREPAVVTLPPGMENIGVIDRSNGSSETGVREAIDRAFSLKSPELDRNGADAALEGLSVELHKNNRFRSVEQVEIPVSAVPASGVFPAPLSWEQVGEICSKHGLDGLFSLEFYDTDSRISYTTRQVTLRGPLGVELPGLEHIAEVHTTVKTGWRIYDGVSREIIDEFLTAETVVTRGRGINPVEAARAVMGRTEAVQTVSGDIGTHYARSILPYWTRVRRDYYVRGTDNFKIARRRAQTGNWDGAAQLWQLETQNRRGKIAGRAHYNMAIINEINGNLEEAIEWAAIAWEDYGDRNALRYLRGLRERQARAELLRLQGR